MNQEECIEKIVQHFTSPAFSEEVKLAKAEFFERSGIVDELSPDFDLRMSQFLDWYIFTRTTSQGKTPLELVISKSEVLNENLEPTIIESLGQIRHSLFDFLKVKGDDIYIKDIVDGKKIIIKKSPIVAGFTTDEIFDARIVPFADSFAFTKGFCFHPPKARKFIMREIKRVKKSAPQEKEGMMLKLLKMRYLFQQYKHVNVSDIYTDEPKLKI